jgi:hypothetical protein
MAHFSGHLDDSMPGGCRSKVLHGRLRTGRQRLIVERVFPD